MTWLALACFAQFFLLALVVPGLTVLRRRIVTKLVTAVALPVVLTLPLAVAAHLWLPAESLLDLLWLQVLAVAFALGLAGLAALAGRRAPWGGPLAVTVAALAVLASPMWGDLLLGAGGPEVRRPALRVLVDVNPLFTVAQALEFDWTHGNLLYHLTRIGEDFAYTPAAVPWLTAGYAAVGLAAAVLAGLVRSRGSAVEIMGAAHF
jgi:hypothetical protein